MDKYRLLAHKEEFVKMIKQAPVSSIGEIWQTLPFKREVYQITNYDLLSDAMIFQTKLDFEFDEGFPIFIKINCKNLIFKLTPDEFKTSRNQLSCAFPKEAKALDSRKKDRTRFPKNSGLSLTLRTFSKNQVTDLKVGIVDLSENGLRIRTTIENAGLFHKGALFKIVLVCGHGHFEESILSAMHVSISATDHKQDVTVGMSSDIPLSGKIFEILREKIMFRRHTAA